MKFKPNIQPPNKIIISPRQYFLLIYDLGKEECIKTFLYQYDKIIELEEKLKEIKND